VIEVFTAGAFWELMNILWYCFITYPLKKLLKKDLPYAPIYIINRVGKEYLKSKGLKGYTIFVRARKD